MKHLTICLSAVTTLLFLRGCSAGLTDFSVFKAHIAVTDEQTSQTTESTTATSLTTSTTTETTTETTSVPNRSGILTSPADIMLNCPSGDKHNYVFTYMRKEYTAIYTPDNWKIVDSFDINNPDDQIVICEALKNEHPIHSANYQSWRTAEDMAYEWAQHNLAYSMLSDTSPLIEDAKDVDINPSGQNKDILDFLSDRII